VEHDLVGRQGFEPRGRAGPDRVGRPAAAARLGPAAPDLRGPRAGGPGAVSLRGVQAPASRLRVHDVQTDRPSPAGVVHLLRGVRRAELPDDGHPRSPGGRGTPGYPVRVRPRLYLDATRALLPGEPAGRASPEHDP